MSGEILIVSSCTASKQQAEHRAVSAESLYTGQQHIRLMAGINAYRAAGQPAGKLCFRILSAHHGLLSPRAAIQSYDYSFSGRALQNIRQQARKKNIPGDMRKLLGRPSELGVLLLGDSYLRACELDAKTKLGGPLIAFCSPAAARRMPPIPGLRTVTLTNAEARRLSCGMIALKGEVGRRLLLRLADNPDEALSIARSNGDVLSWLDSDAPRPQLVAA